MSPAAGHPCGPVDYGSGDRLTPDAHPLTGTIVPLVTPFDADERFAPDGVRPPGRRSSSREGADALMPTALTGEGPLLTSDETIAVWEATFAAANGAVPVIPAIISTTTREAVRLAIRAHALGAAAILVAPVVPELYAGRSRRDVTGFFEAVAGATPLPLILFNYPSLTGVDLTADFLSDLAGIEHVPLREGEHRRQSPRPRHSPAVRGAHRGDLRQPERRPRVAGARVPGLDHRHHERGAAIGPAADGRRASWTATWRARDTSTTSRILPLVDLMFQNSNPTGTIKAGLRARGVDVGVPRRPGSGVSPADAGDARDVRHPGRHRRADLSSELP